jgi:hypothetical protein
MSKQIVFKNFNEEYFNFLKFIKKNLENDTKFNSFYNKNLIIKQTNIKLFIKTWNNRITKNYYEQVMKQDFDFFLNKSYVDDVSRDNTSGEAPSIMLQYIGDFKNTFHTLDETTKNDFIYYMVNLTHLSFLYFKE